jgi:hypothetical protein
MKLFTFLLAVMVLALSCIPCNDNELALDNNKAKAEISKSNQQKEHNNSDSCSPFCICNCCTGFTNISANYRVTIPVMLMIKKVAAHLPAATSNIALPVWQPPQLG